MKVCASIRDFMHRSKASNCYRFVHGSRGIVKVHGFVGFVNSIVNAGRFKHALWLKFARRLKHTWNWDHRSVINARSVKCMVQ